MYESSASHVDHRRELTSETAARFDSDTSFAEPIEVPSPQRAFRTPKCFGCGSFDVRRSRLQSRLERVAVTLLTIIPFRCRDCGLRFWKIETSPATVVKAAFALSTIALALFLTAAFVAW